MPAKNIERLNASYFQAFLRQSAVKIQAFSAEEANAAHIRRQRLPGAPVLFPTGNVSVENIRAAHRAGANDFIKKPVESKVLLDKIAKQPGSASK